MNWSLIFVTVSERLKLAEAKVQEFRNRIDQRKAENYGFASMAAVPYAHVVADLLQNKKPKGATITLAPNPKDIVSHQNGQIGPVSHDMIDLVKSDHVGSSHLEQEDNRVLLACSHSFPEHYSLGRHLIPCKFGFSVSFVSGSPILF
jgi:hypothetical protein